MTDSIELAAEKLAREFDAECFSFHYESGLERIRAALHSANTSLLEENKRLRGACQNVIDCFDTAVWEGLNDLLSPDDERTERLKEVVRNRLMFDVVEKCQEALSQQKEVDPSPSISEVERKVIEAALNHYKNTRPGPLSQESACRCDTCQAVEALPPVKGGG